MMLTQVAGYLREQGLDVYEDVRLAGASGTEHAPDLFCEGEGDAWTLVFVHADRPVTAADVVDAHAAAVDCGAAAALYSPRGASPDARRWAGRFNVTLVDADAVSARWTAPVRRADTSDAPSNVDAAIPLPASSLTATEGVDPVAHLVATLEAPDALAVQVDEPAPVVWAGVLDARAALTDAFRGVLADVVVRVPEPAVVDDATAPDVAPAEPEPVVAPAEDTRVEDASEATDVILMTEDADVDAVDDAPEPPAPVAAAAASAPTPFTWPVPTTPVVDDVVDADEEPGLSEGAAAPLPWHVPPAPAVGDVVTPDDEPGLAVDGPLPWPLPSPAERVARRADLTRAPPSDDEVATQRAFLWGSAARLSGLRLALETEGANSFGETATRRPAGSSWLRGLSASDAYRRDAS